VDISKKALDIAYKNVARNGAQVVTKELDVMSNLSEIQEKHFDIVIADPPAFIKAKKDLPTGRHAYLKMNTAAFKFAKPGGLVVSCSCSGLFEEEMLKEVIEKSIRRNGLRARCVLHGGHSADHPVLLGFTEGFYLKMFVHHVVGE
jgi:23S rRNA (cytosine1962-C5)-methyltransferase